MYSTVSPYNTSLFIVQIYVVMSLSSSVEVLWNVTVLFTFGFVGVYIKFAVGT